MPAVKQVAVKGDKSYEVVWVQSTAPLYRKHTMVLKVVLDLGYALGISLECENFAHYKIQNSFMI